MRNAFVVIFTNYQKDICASNTFYDLKTILVMQEGNEVIKRKPALKCFNKIWEHKMHEATLPLCRNFIQICGQY